MRLKGKVAIVTGGAQGIGRAYCLRFAQEGAAVAVADKRFEQAKGVAAEVTAQGGQAIAIAVDVSDEASAEAMARQTFERFGRIDVLMNNAAIYYDLDLRNRSLAYVRQVLDVNTLGVLACGRAVFPYMKAQGGGSIINIASTAAYPRQESYPPAENFPNYAYGLSKSGVVFLTKAMARTAGLANVRVNAIAPGTTMTEATKRILPPKAMERTRATKAMAKNLEPEDLTGTAVFFASDDSANMPIGLTPQDTSGSSEPHSNVSDFRVLEKLKRYARTGTEDSEYVQVLIRRMEKHLGLPKISDQELLDAYRELEKETQDKKHQAQEKEAAALQEQTAKVEVGNRKRRFGIKRFLTHSPRNNSVSLPVTDKERHTE